MPPGEGEGGGGEERGGRGRGGEGKGEGSSQCTLVQYTPAGAVVIHFSVCHFHEHLLTNCDTTWSVSCHFITCTRPEECINTMHCDALGGS